MNLLFVGIVAKKKTLCQYPWSNECNSKSRQG